MTNFNDKKTIRVLRKKIKENYGSKVERYITVKMLQHLLVRYINTHNVEDIKYIEQEFFDDNDKMAEIFDIFGNYKKQIFINVADNKLYFSISLTTLIQEYFDNIVYAADVVDLRNQEDEENPIPNIIGVDTFIEKHNHAEFFARQIKDNDVKHYVPNNVMKINNLHTLLNRKEDFKFLLNPTIKISNKLNISELDEVNKYDLFVNKIVFTDNAFGAFIVSEYVIKCPACAEDVSYLPFQTHTNLKHGCTGFYSEKGDQKYTMIKKTSLQTSISTPVYLYECFLTKDRDSKIFIYSLHNNLKPGRYKIDVYNCHAGLDGVSNEQFFMMLGMEQMKVKLKNDFVDEKVVITSQLYCKENNIPFHPILNLLFAIRKIHKQYNNININNKGTLLQLFSIISGVGKCLFHYNKIAISVVGNTSLSKTYSAALYAIMFDPNYTYIENGDNVSGPGLKGGINNKKMVNGKAISIFEKGKFTTAGLCVFDEGQNFYNDPILNSALKNFLNDKISISKIGGEDGIEQNYTPLIFCNMLRFYQEHYKKSIEMEYVKFVRYEGANMAFPHKMGLRWINKYINTVNLSLPINYYITQEKNECLAKAITLVREKYFYSDIDWRTGGSIPSSFRILLDVLCDNQDKQSNIVERKSEYTKSKLPELYEVPWEEWQEYLSLRVLGDKYINLYNEHTNSEEVNAQLEKLRENISKFILEDGLEIHKHLSMNKAEIDPKLNSIMYNVIIILQLLEDINATELTKATKEWAKMILLKCKRGITVNEYNFIQHKYVADKVYYDYNNLNVEVQELEEKNKRDEEQRIATEILNLGKTKVSLEGDLNE